MNNKEEKFARLGVATKGVVYILIGGLSALAAFGMGGQKTGSSGVLQFLGGQPFGQVLLMITAVGLTGYVFYRFYQAIKDPGGKGNNTKGILIRTGYIGSGLFYGALAVSAVRAVWGSGSSGQNQEGMIAMLLGKSFGQLLVGAVAVVFLIKAIYQLYKAYSGKYRKGIDSASLDVRIERLLMNAGKIGYTSRGIVLGIIAFLTFRAAATANSAQAGGTEDAFSFLQNEFGTVVLLIITLGLLAYGVFLFIQARYGRLSFVG